MKPDRMSGQMHLSDNINFTPPSSSTQYGLGTGTAPGLSARWISQIGIEAKLLILIFYKIKSPENFGAFFVCDFDTLNCLWQ